MLERFDPENEKAFVGSELPTQSCCSSALRSIIAGRFVDLYGCKGIVMVCYTLEACVSKYHVQKD